MKPSVMMLLAAASMPLAACASTNDWVAAAEPAPAAPAEYQSAAATPPTCTNVGTSALTGAGVGGVGGAAVGAVTGGSILTGALVGAAVGGLAGAVWADANNDGCADGYMREGRYYEGAPTVQPVPADYRSGERG